MLKWQREEIKYINHGVSIIRIAANRLLSDTQQLRYIEQYLKDIVEDVKIATRGRAK